MTLSRPPSAAPIVEPKAAFADPVTDIAGLEPLDAEKSRWPALFGAIVTLAMIFGLGRQLFHSGLAGFSHSMPTSPLFYIAYAAFYMSLPVADYIIYHRLWHIPIAGLGALVRKRIANDVVLGYSGEAYFYAWARTNAKMVAAPFGAVKDVTILSAIAGNAITLFMIALTLPLARDWLSGEQLRIFVGSAGIAFVTSLPFLIFSKRVFTLKRSRLWWIFGVHCARLILGSVLIAILWHLALPDVSLGMWLLLAAARLLVSRLPLVPNKDLLFANFAIMVIGQETALSQLMAVTGALILATHIALIIVFGIHSLWKRARVEV